MSRPAAQIAELEHPAELRASFAPDAVAYIEPPPPADGDVEAAALAGYSAQRLPLTLPVSKPDYEKPNPQLGVGLLQWSPGGKFLATRNDSMPRALWVWDPLRGLRSLVVQQGPIRAAAWHPTRQLLAFCSGSAKVYVWSPQGCRTAPLPAAGDGAPAAPAAAAAAATTATTATATATTTTTPTTTTTTTITTTTQTQTNRTSTTSTWKHLHTRKITLTLVH